MVDGGSEETLFMKLLNTFIRLSLLKVLHYFSWLKYLLTPPLLSFKVVVSLHHFIRRM